jgi:membrane-bound metal-dependent hydrolase YbcI (DUF457 family)
VATLITSLGWPLSVAESTTAPTQSHCNRFVTCEAAKRVAFGCWLALSSHALLDAMTDGEPGVALWSPIITTRHFLGWRPIPVSPDTIGPFFSEWGMRVLKVELWFGLAAWLAALAIVRATGHREAQLERIRL